MLLSVTKTNNSNPTIGELKCKSQNARSSRAFLRQPLPGGVVSQASAKPQADLPAKWDREADVVILGYGGAGASPVFDT